MTRKSKILKAVHQTAVELYKARAFSLATMHGFDKLCPMPPKTKARRDKTISFS